jgi:signal transduction histidine kinase
MPERTVTELQYLAAAMAHEVRNPLNSMAIHVELLDGRLRREKAPPEALKSLAVLAAEIERVDKILEQYLSFAGPGEAARTAVEAARLLDGAVADVKPLADERGVNLDVRTTPGALGKWAIDAAAVGEALRALVRNAVEASPRGTTVVLSARSDGDTEQAEIAVADAGEPVADNEGAKFFHMGSKRSHGGVGLTVAKQIVKGHGGSLTVKRSDGGNVMTMRLPLDVGDDEDDE